MIPRIPGMLEIICCFSLKVERGNLMKEKIDLLKKFLIFLAVIVIVYMSSPALPDDSKDMGGKVAAVNGSVITKEDFNREIIRVNRRLASAGRPANKEQLPELKKDVLETLINRELLYQESQKSKIMVEETVVNEQLKMVKKDFPSDDAFKTAMAKMDLSEEDIKTQIRKGMTIERFIDERFGMKIQVSDSEMKDYYDSRSHFFKNPEQVRASHILVKAEANATEAQKKAAGKKIKEIQLKLKNGDDFAEVAKADSEGPSAGKGGDLGYFRRGQMVKPFEEKAFSMNPRQVSDPVETKFGYHLILVTDKKPESTIPYEDVKDKLKQYMLRQKVQEQVNAYIKVIKEKAKVERFM